VTAALNATWATALATTLADFGLRHAALSPGSRSAPLAIALRREERIEVTVHIDERSAAYFALGAARATGRASAAVCTSGTAAANYLPAIVEADRAMVPFLALTADRPPELRDAGANQTIDQAKLYGERVRWFHDPGTPHEDAMAALVQAAARAWTLAHGPVAGPVHLNLPFREPLVGS
jgi:2-succinyl-5-enolpyruvyl-6-hydroxy-3-cyclohexene-1-carboxylate synthase